MRESRISMKKLGRDVRLALITLMLICTNAVLPIALSSRVDMQGEPSTVLGYLGSGLALVFGIVWWSFVHFLDWLGGLFVVSLVFPVFVGLTVVAGQGVLPDLDFGLYIHAMCLILAMSCLAASLLARYIAPLKKR